VYYAIWRQETVTLATTFLASCGKSTRTGWVAR
jgi:hypothetical protein